MNTIHTENMTEPATRERSLKRRVRCGPFAVGVAGQIPRTLAVCPECSGNLWWEVMSTDGLEDLLLTCGSDDDEVEEWMHRGWQSEWQPVIDRVRQWLEAGAPNV